MKAAKTMVVISEFISKFPVPIQGTELLQPWQITSTIKELLEKMIFSLGSDFHIHNGIAIHKTAAIETHVTFKRPVIVLENCFIGANSYFREGVFLDSGARIGPGCEVKSSIICGNTALAHLNYVGNSIIGANVNFEAGAIAANHFNERTEKSISVLYKDSIIKTGATKFGSLIGDNSKIGANAVLSPGTLLLPNSIVKRLELVEQVTI